MSLAKDRLWTLLKMLAIRKDPVDVDQAIKLFALNPSGYFSARAESTLWPAADEVEGRPVYPSDMRVLVRGHTLGFVERVKCSAGTATVGHIAIAKSLSGQGKGLGVLLARAYAAELRSRYGIDRIVFAEDSSKYYEGGYPSFFRRLGAQALPVDPRTQRKDRPDYEWLEKDWGI